MESSVLFVFASWEERCELGVQESLSTRNIRDLVVWYSEEYASRTEGVRDRLNEAAKETGVEFTPVKIRHREPSSWWLQIQAKVIEVAKQNTSVIFDYSTCPRNVMWCVLSALSTNSLGASLIYYPPGHGNSYGRWLSADPEWPEFVYGHSGNSDPLKKTGLVVSSGFDVQRTAQLYNVYEPERMIVLLQSGDQFENGEKNLKEHLDWLAGRNDGRLSWCEVNAYAPDRAYGAVLKCIDEIEPTCNVVLASLGPKPGSVGMYRAWMARCQCALAYVPSRQYNEDYSKGKSEPLFDEFRKDL